MERNLFLLPLGDKLGCNANDFFSFYLVLKNLSTPLSLHAKALL